MTIIERLVLKHLNDVYGGFRVVQRIPKWLKDEYWRPRFLLKKRSGNCLVGVDLVLSGEIPKYQYTVLIPKLVEEHPELSVVVVTLEESYEREPEIAEFCAERGLGLKVVVRDVGVETVVRIEEDPERFTAEITEEAGWFPSAILEQARGLENLVFHGLIDDFVDRVGSEQEDQSQVTRLVLDTMRAVLESHPAFTASMRRLMQLEHFEMLLRLAEPDASDHVLHSFRVFLAGCPILSKFYETFNHAHRRFCVGPDDRMCVEYAWALAALFHDIGRPKEDAAAMLERELDDNDIEVRIRGKTTRWTHVYYQTARRTLGSLGAFIASASPEEQWDAGSVEDADAESAEADWMGIYDRMESHAVISAFDFLGDVFKNAAAGDFRGSRPFVLTHAVPAALAILLHDWKIWKQAGGWGLFPVNVSVFPLAGLLIYIDTWDDFRRRGSDQRIHVKSYRVDGRGVYVRVEWGDSQEFSNEQIKYREFKKALMECPFSLKIKAGMVGEV